MPLKSLLKPKAENKLDLVRKKDNRTGIIVSVGIHLSLLFFVFMSKGCIELQNPPQFTLEEVVVLDFSEKGGGSPGSASPQQPQPVVKDPAPQEVTQEESPVVTPTSSNTQNATSEETTAEPEKPKNDFSNLFGHGSGNDQGGNGQGEGTGIGTGSGPDTGGGMGDGKGRQVIGNPELANPKSWEGFVMVQFIIDASGNVISTKVLKGHSKTTINLTSSDQSFIESDCMKKFKFTPTSTGSIKDRLVKRIQYIRK